MGAEPLRILCFLSEVAQPGLQHQFASYEQMSQFFHTVVGSDVWLRETVGDLDRTDSVDHFSSMVDRSRAVLKPKKDLSFNGLRSPCTVTADSNIGIFLRSVLARWDCLQFHELCELYSRTKEFMQASHAKDTVITPRFDPNSQFRFSHRCRPDSTSCSSHHGDSRSVEAELHMVYDRSGHDITLNPSVSDDSSAAQNVAAALHAFLHSEKDATFASLKHQYALLQLGRMWLGNGNAVMAMAAIEEALKTAHHLGDHEAVAHALLLLFEVVRGSEDPVVATSAEDILLRCSQRCAALHMQGLMGRCTLLLASLRARQNLQQNGAQLVDETASNGATGTARAGWKAEEVWAQMHFALLGEIALSAQVVSKRGVTDDSEFTQTGATSLNPMLQQQQSIAARKENLQDLPLNLGEELAQLTVEYALNSADLWHRLDMPAMAEFTLRRALAGGKTVARAGESAVGRIFTRLLEAQVDWVRVRREAAADQSGGELLQQVLTLGRDVKRALKDASERDLVLSRHLESALVGVLYELAVEARDDAKAVRLSERLCSLTASPMTTSAGEETSGDPTTVPLLSDAHFRARLRHVEAVARRNITAALQSLASLRSHCSAANPADTVRGDQCDRCHSRILQQQAILPDTMQE